MVRHHRFSPPRLASRQHIGFLAAVLLFAIVGAGYDARARTFYVDAARGDDAKDGQQPETAWRSLARVNHASLAPGDSVLFKRGQSWRRQLVPQSGSAQGVVTYGAYGEGAKPVLLGSVAADRPEDWEPAGKGLWTTRPLRFEPAGVLANLRPEN